MLTLLSQNAVPAYTAGPVSAGTAQKSGRYQLCQRPFSGPFFPCNQACVNQPAFRQLGQQSADFFPLFMKRR
jgi:hypothetical protein